MSIRLGNNSVVKLSIGAQIISRVYVKSNTVYSGEWAPFELFTNFEPGVWYDPSDFSTMFQDAAGTTPVTAVEQPVGLMLDKSGNGNHASQTTATSRPVLSARYNLLTKTEQFDDVAWAKYTATVTANATTAPNGTLTADTLTATGSGGAISVTQPLAGTYTISVYAKAGTSSTIFLTWSSNANGRQATFTLSGPGTAGVVSTVGTGGVVSGGTSSIISVGNGWYRCVISDLVCGANSGGFIISVLTQNKTAYIWGASLVPANQAHLPYQRVNTATDYNTVGFPHYLRFDGVDDWLVTNTITPGTDKAQVFAGVRKLSDAVTAVLYELSANANVNNGAFYLAAPESSGVPNYAWKSRGDANTFSFNAVTFTAPITNVLTGLGDISGDSAILRVNGTQAASSTADQGTGNYLAYPLYIGRRGGTSLPFNGRLYSLIVRFGSNLPTATIEKTEKYINGLTKAY